MANVGGDVDRGSVCLQPCKELSQGQERPSVLTDNNGRDSLARENQRIGLIQ
jgi:hypothetical protein